MRHIAKILLLTSVFGLAACDIDVVLPSENGGVNETVPTVVDLNARTQSTAVINGVEMR